MKGNFVKQKKAKVRCYTSPAYLTNKTGILGITEDGIFSFGDKYNKVFLVNMTSSAKVSNYERIKGSMMVLRGFDIPFSCAEDVISSKTYLSISVIAKNFDEADMLLSKIKDEMQSSMYTFGLVLSEMNAQDRFRTMHTAIVEQRKNPRLDVNNYLKKAEAWLPDFDLSKFKNEHSSFVTELCTKRYFFVRRIPSENISEIYEIIRNCSLCDSIMLDYEPVSDEDVQKKMQSLYNDIPVISVTENERKYIFAGIYFCLNGDEKVYSEKLEQLSINLIKYGGEILPLYERQKEAFLSFLTYNNEAIRNNRIVEVKNAVKLSPFNDEYKKKNAKDGLLQAFDSFFEEDEACQ